MEKLDLEEFPRIDKDHWKKLAEKQLKGENPDENLRWKNDSIHELDAYFDSSDLEGLDYLKNFFSKISPHRWKLYEEIEVSDVKTANKKILDALMGGCDGIILSIEDSDLLDGALQDVNRKICDVSIRSSQTFNKEDLTGFQLTPTGNCFQSEANKNPIDQIEGILKGDEQPFVYRNAFKDFFLEIASLRALRYLLEESGRHPHLHTRIPTHESDEHQWFLNTTAGLASIIGGTHSVDFHTATGDSRISRNTGNLIREESGITEYSDQCGGSYYVEVLTDKIINSVKERLK